MARAESDTLGLCLDLARRGVGLTVVPISSLLRHDLGASITGVPMPKQTVTWAMVVNEARAHSAAVRSGKRLLVENLRDHDHLVGGRR